MNFIEQDYEAILNRMKEFLRVRDDHEVAKELGVTRSALSDFKKRKRFPAERIIQFCLTHGLVINWMLTGQGSMFGEKVGMIAEQISPYGPRLDEILKKVIIIYEEGDLDARAKVMGIIDAVHDELLRIKEKEMKRKELDATHSLIPSREGNYNGKKKEISVIIEGEEARYKAG